MKKHPGFILPMVTMLLSIAVLLVMSMYRRGSIFVPFMTTIVHRQKAKQLALSGIQIAISELSEVAKKKEQEKKVPPSEDQDNKLLLSSLLPELNQWQEYLLKKEGIKETIKISISAESGKIDLNEIYDFNKRSFKDSWKKILPILFQKIKKQMNIESKLFEPFEKLLKERQYKFNDATELLTLEPFRVFAGNIFYEPPKKDKKGKRPLYLLDIFTVYGTDKMQPWLFSDSMRSILGIKRTVSKDQKKKEMVKEQLKKFKSETDWKQQWNAVLKPVYGIELQGLPNGVDSVLDKKFAPTMFSVVSYGIVGDVTQRAYAIIERNKKVAKQQTTYDFKIRRFYWM